MRQQAADVPAGHVGDAGVPVSEKNSGSPPFQRDWWQCMPEPLSWNSGLGMNVTERLLAHATDLVMYL